MRCRSCNVLNMHALGKRVTQISMNARAVAGVNEVNCLGMLGCGMWGQLLIGVSPYPQFKANNIHQTTTHVHNVFVQCALLTANVIIGHNKYAYRPFAVKVQNNVYWGRRV